MNGKLIAALLFIPNIVVLFEDKAYALHGMYCEENDMIVDLQTHRYVS